MTSMGPLERPDVVSSFVNRTSPFLWGLVPYKRLQRVVISDMYLFTHDLTLLLAMELREVHQSRFLLCMGFGVLLFRRSHFFRCSSVMFSSDNAFWAKLR